MQKGAHLALGLAWEGVRPELSSGGMTAGDVDSQKSRGAVVMSNPDVAFRKETNMHDMKRVVSANSAVVAAAAMNAVIVASVWNSN